MPVFFVSFNFGWTYIAQPGQCALAKSVSVNDRKLYCQTNLPRLSACYSRPKSVGRHSFCLVSFTGAFWLETCQTGWHHVMVVISTAMSPWRWQDMVSVLWWPVTWALSGHSLPSPASGQAQGQLLKVPLVKPAKRALYCSFYSLVWQVSMHTGHSCQLSPVDVQSDTGVLSEHHDLIHVLQQLHVHKPHVFAIPAT